MTRGVYLIGDSHTAAVLKGRQLLEAEGMLKRPYVIRLASNGYIAEHFTLDLASGETIINPAVSTHFQIKARPVVMAWDDHHVALMFGGVQHALFAQEASGREFGEHGSSQGWPGAPRGLIEAVFEDLFVRFAHGLALLRELTPEPFLVVEGPPPAPNAVIDAKEIARGGRATDEPSPIADPAFRRMTYEASGRVLRRMAESVGAPFVPAPPEAFADGLLRPDLVADAYHANGGYGRMVIDAIETAITAP